MQEDKGCSMKVGIITISDDLLFKALGIDKKAIILNVKRNEYGTATLIFISHPKLRDLLECEAPVTLPPEEMQCLLKKSKN